MEPDVVAANPRSNLCRLCIRCHKKVDKYSGSIPPFQFPVQPLRTLSSNSICRDLIIYVPIVIWKFPSSKLPVTSFTFLRERYKWKRNRSGLFSGKFLVNKMLRFVGYNRFALRTYYVPLCLEIQGLVYCRRIDLSH